jgi:hypothetical protein
MFDDLGGPLEEIRSFDFLLRVGPSDVRREPTSPEPKKNKQKNTTVVASHTSQVGHEEPQRGTGTRGPRSSPRARSTKNMSTVDVNVKLFPFGGHASCVA